MRCTSEVYAVLLAAGLGTRMGQNKLVLRFQGKTPLRLCYEAFLRSQCPPKGIAIAVSEQTRLPLRRRMHAFGLRRAARRAGLQCAMRCGRCRRGE